MTLSAPAAISIVGHALQVRHLRANATSWVVWTFNDDGTGDRFAYRQRTGTINLVGALRTDGVDFSERVIPLPPVKVKSFHVLELSGGNAVCLFSDGTRLFQFTWNVVTNTIVEALEPAGFGDIPSQYFDGNFVRQLYVRDKDVKVRSVDDLSDFSIIDPTGTEALEMDIVRKGVTTLGRYAGTQLINRDLALPYLVSPSTVLCYNRDEDLIAVTEALPPGAVSYFTFDSAHFSGSTMLNQVGGGTNATLVGTAPTSVAGQVGDARQFPGGGGNAHYSIANHAAVQITGNQSIAFWMRPTNFTQRVNPIHKAYAGEFSTTLETDGTLSYFYGTAGNDTNPYQGYSTQERIFLNEWSHLAFVRDLTNRKVLGFINGEITSHATAQFAAAGAGSQAVTIGRGYTLQVVSGMLDEMILANQAWSPQTVRNLYEKGKLGLAASVSGSASARRLLDSSANARHGYLSRRALQTLAGHTATRRDPYLPPVISLPAFVTPSTLTIEARLYPRGSDPADRVLFGNRVGIDSSGNRLQGTIEFVYTSAGLLRFRYETTTATVELQQTGGEKLRQNQLNNVAVAHTFGAGGSSMLVVNGSPVPTRWVGGNGNETPTLLAAAPTISVGDSDDLIALRVSNVVKSITAIRDCLRGRA